MVRQLLTALGLTAMTTFSAAAQDILPYPFHIDDYANGLRLITIPTDFPDVVSVHIVVATGSRNEVEEGKSGFAHFFEHMMFRGTKNYSSTEQAAAFKQAGADRNAYTTNDFTNYHTTVTKADLETVLRLEADRFRYLEYGEKAFRTEAMAVFGEYNKNSANPVTKAFEVMRDVAFDRHTYKHTTMGFLRDIRAMPTQFDYSKEFFARWYKPEYTTLLVVGDVTREGTKALVDKYWSDWPRGTFEAEIPVEPPQTEPRETHVKWPAETQPWVFIAFKGPAADPASIEMPALDLLASVAFSPSSELYRRLYVRERKVDQLWSYFPDSTDPFLLILAARLRDPADWRYVRDALLAECESLKTAPIDTARLTEVKRNLRYSFASSLDSSEAIASALSGYIARWRTPDTVNEVFRSYETVTPEQIQAVASRYFVAAGRTITTLSHEPLPGEVTAETAAAPVEEPVADEPAAAEPVAADPADAQPSAGDPAELALPSTVLVPSASPLVTFRLQLATGAAADPADKAGLAHLTARLLADGGTRQRSYEEMTAAMFPLAADLGVRVDKQMTTFTGTVHRDNLDEYYALLREVLQQPGFHEADFERVRADVRTAIETGLQKTDDEELGKEVLYASIYGPGHPFGHTNFGTLAGLEAITLADVQTFYRRHFHGDNLTIGLAGGYPPEFARRVHADFFGDAKASTSASASDAASSQGAASDAPAQQRGAIPPAPPIEKNRMTIVQKPALATGLHIGMPIDVRRGDPDWVALWLVRSYFGEHRSENSYLYQRLREIRGLNYGDYAYIEYFPDGGRSTHPPANVARDSQIFQIWIRPVPPQNGPFALKAAMFELEKLVRDGLSQADFEATRDYLAKFVALLVKTDDRRLGYALDSRFYGTDEFVAYVRDGLGTLTREDVNRAIKTHLRADRLQFVVVTEDAEAFRDQILGGEPTPIHYQAKPGEDILAEDKVIEAMRLDLQAENVVIVGSEAVFAK